MKEIDNRLFYQVCGWMINDLHLEGKELICYAIIYSLSQLGQGRYYAGLDYLASFMQCSQPTASKAVDGLYTKKLIDKQVVVTETGRRVLYFCTDPENRGKENIYGGVHKKFMDPTSYNINKENKEKRISNDIQKKEDDLFVQFWEKYDYKKGKAKAESAWRKLSKKDKQDAIKAIDVYKEDCRKCDREMKHPATYINQRTWEDDFSCSGKLSKDEEEKEEWPAGITRDQWGLVKLWLDKHVPFIADKITPEMFLDMKGRAHFKGDVFKDIIIEINNSGYDGDILSEFERLRFTEPYATRIDL